MSGSTRLNKVVLAAEVAAFIADMERAGHSAEQVGRAVQSGAKQATAAQRDQAQAAKKAAQEQESAARRGKRAVEDTAQTLTRVALVGGAALAATGKAAIDWETSWAGVTKSVSGAGEEMEAQLRGLAKTLPATHDEIAAVAEAAGQLGVKTSDVVGFTETMVKLGETTNLTADEAATSLAQISNVMGTLDGQGVDGINRMANALVYLGNNGASTERDIVNMASRLAGAAKTVGMTEPDLLAVANALSSVGIEAEAGGTAFSNVLIKMSKSVKTGNEDLQRFADVAGMTTDQFAKAFQERPAAAVEAFTTGLGRIQQAGGDVFTVLEDLGMSDVRVTSAMLKMAGAGDLFAQSLADGVKGYAENSAMQQEFQKRLDTTASRIQIARNNIRDAAITLGTSLAPAISAVADGASSLAETIAAIPAPVRNVALGVAGLASAGVLAASGVAKLVDVGRKAGEALDYIGTKSPRAASGLSGVGKAAVVAGKALGALTAVGGIVNAIDGDGSGHIKLQQLQQDLLNGGDAIASWDRAIAGMEKNGFWSMGKNVDDLGSALRAAFGKDTGAEIGHGIDKILNGVTLGAAGLESVVDKSNKAIADMDSMLAGLVSSGHADLAAKQLDQIAEYAQTFGITSEQLAGKLPQYGEALAAVGNQAKLAGDKSQGAAGGVDDFGGSIDEAAQKAADAQQAIDDLAQSFSDLGAQLLGQRGSARDFQAAVDAATEAVKNNGKTLKIGTEAGRENQAALDAIASSTAEWAARATEAGASASEVSDIMRSGRKAFIDAATDMGMSAFQAGLLADKLGLIPKDVKTQFEAAGVTEATTQTETYTTAVDNVPAWARTTFETPGSDTAQGEAVDMKAKVDNVPAWARTTFETPGSDTAQSEADDTKKRVESIPTWWETLISTPGATESQKLAWGVRDAANSIPNDVLVAVRASTAAATSAINGVANALTRINGRTATTYVRTVYRTEGPGRSTYGGQVREDGGITEAYGGRVRHYAGGGIALATGAYVPRIPQISSGSGGILWQEPVTGWEAYISGKPGMERRNLGVWADAGSRLGVPQWVLDLAKTRMRFADGGTIGTAPAAMGGFPDAGVLGQIIGGQVRAALTGMSVQLDDGRTVGRLVDAYRLGYAGGGR